MTVRLRALVAFTCAGAALCTSLDYLHATHGVLFYRTHELGPQSFWVPALFAGASAATLLGAETTRKVFRGSPYPAEARGITEAAIAFVTAYSITSFLHPLPNALLAVLVLFWLARVVRDAPAWVVLFSIFVAIGGTLFEAALSSTGAFTYEHPDVLGVARWLPGIYLHAAPLAARLAPLVFAGAPAISSPEAPGSARAAR